MHLIFRGLSLTALLLLTANHPLFAQVKFGKLSDAEREMMEVPGDSTAEAYVLHHSQDLTFDYLNDRGIVQREIYHRRVKLIRPSSFSRADISLRYTGYLSDLSGLRAMIHLPNGEKVKLKGRDFIREDLNDDVHEVKFTFPRVEPGAVIEYTFSRLSTTIQRPTPFIFQEDIPVAYAEYTALIPEYFNYISLGTHGNFTVSEREDVMQPFGTIVRHGEGAGTANIRQERTRYVMEDIPAYEVQPYTNNASDYLPRVHMQLRSVKFPNQPTHFYLEDWFATAKRLDEDGNFGKCYQSSGASNKLWEAAEPVVMAGKTAGERLERAYYFISQHLEWNENYSWLASDQPDKVFAAGTGNSADLNLSLLALLRRAGIEAYPALLSLRDRGNHIEVYPIMDQFDHVIVYAEVDGKAVLLDADGTARPPGLPRERALNHRAWIARPGAPQWIAVEAPAAQQIVMANITIDDSGAAKAKIQSRLSDYFAFEGRYRAARSESLTDQPIAADILDVFPDAKVLELNTDEADNPADPLGSTMTLQVPAAMASADYLYVQPILLRLLDEELDDVETRIYPVDFPHPWNKQFIANITPPEGYTLEELPKSVRLVSEDRGMEAMYSASVKPDNTISVRLAVKLDRTVYPAASYPALRNMYRQIIELQEAPIVLKRAK